MTILYVKAKGNSKILNNKLKANLQNIDDSYWGESMFKQLVSKKPNQFACFAIHVKDSVKNPFKDNSVISDSKINPSWLKASDATIIGYCLGYMYKCPSRNSKIALKGWIPSIAVNSSYRGNGVGAKLLALMLDRFRTSKSPITKIMLQTDPNESDQQKFYRKFKYRSARFRREQLVPNAYGPSHHAIIQILNLKDIK